MNTKVRRVTANIPVELLDRACSTTKRGITETLIEGLKRIDRRSSVDAALAMRGKFKLELDIDELRGRNRP